VVAGGVACGIGVIMVKKETSLSSSHIVTYRFDTILFIMVYLNMLYSVEQQDEP
jgi:hypothetical protein